MVLIQYRQTRLFVSNTMHIDLKSTLEGLFSIIFGLIFVIFHNNLGEDTAKFQAKYMEYFYTEEEKKSLRSCFY